MNNNRTATRSQEGQALSGQVKSEKGSPCHYRIRSGGPRVVWVDVIRGRGWGVHSLALSLTCASSAPSWSEYLQEKKSKGVI